MSWTFNDLEKKKADGKIKGFQQVVVKRDTPTIGGRKVGKHFSRKSKGLDFIAKNLFYWCQERSFVLEEEYKFHPERKFRFDFAIPSLKIACEFDGGIFDRNGSHTSVKDIKRDADKKNSAAVMGWRVLTFNALNYTTLLTELNKLL